ncbi:hypothetical protein ADUPG1_008380, partial [Aduncisulcus paluster]
EKPRLQEKRTREKEEEEEDSILELDGSSSSPIEASNESVFNPEFIHEGDLESIPISRDAPIIVHPCYSKIKVTDNSLNSSSRYYDLNTQVLGMFRGEDRSVFLSHLFIPFQITSDIKGAYICVNKYYSSRSLIFTFSRTPVHSKNKEGKVTKQFNFSPPQNLFEWYFLPIHMQDVSCCEIEGKESWSLKSGNFVIKSLVFIREESDEESNYKLLKSTNLTRKWDEAIIVKPIPLKSRPLEVYCDNPHVISPNFSRIRAINDTKSKESKDYNVAKKFLEFGVESGHKKEFEVSLTSVFFPFAIPHDIKGINMRINKFWSSPSLLFVFIHSNRKKTMKKCQLLRPGVPSYSWIFIPFNVKDIISCEIVGKGTWKHRNSRCFTLYDFGFVEDYQQTIYSSSSSSSDVFDNIHDEDSQSVVFRTKKSTTKVPSSSSSSSTSLPTSQNPSQPPVLSTESPQHQKSLPPPIFDEKMTLPSLSDETPAWAITQSSSSPFSSGTIYRNPQPKLVDMPLLSGHIDQDPPLPKVDPSIFEVSPQYVGRNDDFPLMWSDSRIILPSIHGVTSVDKTEKMSSREYDTSSKAKSMLKGESALWFSEMSIPFHELESVKGAYICVEKNGSSPILVFTFSCQLAKTTLSDNVVIKFEFPKPSHSEQWYFLPIDLIGVQSCKITGKGNWGAKWSLGFTITSLVFIRDETSEQELARTSKEAALQKIWFDTPICETKFICEANKNSLPLFRDSSTTIDIPSATKVVAMDETKRRLSKHFNQGFRALNMLRGGKEISISAISVPFSSKYDLKGLYVCVGKDDNLPLILTSFCDCNGLKTYKKFQFMRSGSRSDDTFPDDSNVLEWHYFPVDLDNIVRFEIEGIDRVSRTRTTGKFCKISFEFSSLIFIRKEPIDEETIRLADDSSFNHLWDDIPLSVAQFLDWGNNPDPNFPPFLQDYSKIISVSPSSISGKNESKNRTSKESDKSKEAKAIIEGKEKKSFTFSHLTISFNCAYSLRGIRTRIDLHHDSNLVLLCTFFQSDGAKCVKKYQFENPHPYQYCATWQYLEVDLPNVERCEIQGKMEWNGKLNRCFNVNSLYFIRTMNEKEQIFIESLNLASIFRHEVIIGKERFFTRFGTDPITIKPDLVGISAYNSARLPGEKGYDVSKRVQSMLESGKPARFSYAKIPFADPISIKGAYVGFSKIHGPKSPLFTFTMSDNRKVIIKCVIKRPSTVSGRYFLPIDLNNVICCEIEGKGTWSNKHLCNFMIGSLVFVKGDIDTSISHSFFNPEKVSKNRCIGVSSSLSHSIIEDEAEKDPVISTSKSPQASHDDKLDVNERIGKEKNDGTKMKRRLSFHSDTTISLPKGKEEKENEETQVLKPSGNPTVFEEVGDTLDQEKEEEVDDGSLCLGDKSSVISTTEYINHNTFQASTLMLPQSSDEFKQSKLIKNPDKSHVQSKESDLKEDSKQILVENKISSPKTIISKIESSMMNEKEEENDDILSEAKVPQVVSDCSDRVTVNEEKCPVYPVQNTPMAQNQISSKLFCDEMILKSSDLITPLYCLGKGKFGEVLLVNVKGISLPCVLKKMLRVADKRVVKDCRKEFKVQLKIYNNPKCFTRIPQPLYILDLLDADMKGVYGFITEFCVGGSVDEFSKNWCADGKYVCDDYDYSESDDPEDSSSSTSGNESILKPFDPMTLNPLKFCVGGSVDEFSKNWCADGKYVCDDYDYSESDDPEDSSSSTSGNESILKPFDPMTLNPLKVCSLCVGMIECLDDVFTAKKKLIHRDIKPENFLIRVDPNSKQFTVVLCDVGLSRIQDCLSSSSVAKSFLSSSSLECSSSDQFVCSYGYYAYEMLVDGLPSQLSDAYSLGMSILSLFLCSMPFSDHPLLKGISTPIEYVHKLSDMISRSLTPKLSSSPLFNSLLTIEEGTYIPVHSCLNEVFLGLTQSNPMKRMSVHDARVKVQSIKSLLPSIGEGWKTCTGKDGDILDGKRRVHDKDRENSPPSFPLVMSIDDSLYKTSGWYDTSIQARDMLKVGHDVLLSHLSIPFPSPSPMKGAYICVYKNHSSPSLLFTFTDSDGKKISKKYEFPEPEFTFAWFFLPIDLDNVVLCEIEGKGMWENKKCRNFVISSLVFTMPEERIGSEPLSCLPFEHSIDDNYHHDNETRIESKEGRKDEEEEKGIQMSSTTCVILTVEPEFIHKGSYYCCPIPRDAPNIKSVEFPSFKAIDGTKEEGVEEYMMKGEGSCGNSANISIPFSSSIPMEGAYICLSSYPSSPSHLIFTLTSSKGEKTSKKYEFHEFEEYRWYFLPVDLPDVVLCEITGKGREKEYFRIETLIFFREETPEETIARETGEKGWSEAPVVKPEFVKEGDRKSKGRHSIPIARDDPKLVHHTLSMVNCKDDAFRKESRYYDRRSNAQKMLKGKYYVQLSYLSIPFLVPSPLKGAYICVDAYNSSPSLLFTFTDCDGKKTSKKYEFRKPEHDYEWHFLPIDLHNVVLCEIEGKGMWREKNSRHFCIYSLVFTVIPEKIIAERLSILPWK